MRITTIDAWPVEMRLAEPYSVAYETIDRTVNVFVRIETTGPIVGYGAAAPDMAVTGESVEGTLSALGGIVADELKGADPLRIALINERLREPLRRQPSVRAAVDMALHDLLGKICGQPLWRLLGGFRDRIETSVTIGVLPEDETVAAARRQIALGFRVLKLKGGLDAEADAARVSSVREAVGPRIQLRFDANQGYTVDQALRFVELARVAGIELLEQPTPSDQLDALGRVTRQTSLPVMADESLLTLRDAFRLVRDDLVNMVNIKLMKTGGIAEAMMVDAVARAARCEVMVGCMDEAELSIAAGLHFALARPNVAFADLDGHLDLLGDPSRGTVRLVDGALIPNDAPGLGVVLDG